MLIGVTAFAQTTVTNTVVNIVNITNIVNIVNVTNVITITNRLPTVNTSLHISQASLDWLSFQETLAARRRAMFQQQYWMSIGIGKGLDK